MALTWGEGPQECLARVWYKSVLQECTKSVPPECLKVPHRTFPQERPTVADKSVPQEFPRRVSYKGVSQECPTRAPLYFTLQCPTSVLQECPTSVSHKSAPRECPTRVSYKSVPRERPTRVSHKSVIQECPARVHHKRVPQQCPSEVATWSTHVVREAAFGSCGIRTATWKYKM